LAKPETVPRLEWTETPERREAFHLTSAEIVIGRRSDVDILLTHPLVSRQHLRIVREDQREGPTFVVIDLQSSHGTWVNGVRIDRHPLRPRDRIRLGQQGVELLFLIGDDSQTSASTGAGLLEEAGIERSVKRLATVLPEESAAAHSELEKISCLLDFHYYFGKAFSPDKTFQHILKSALGISGAERGFILRKNRSEFAYAVGLDSAGNSLGQSEFRTSGSVVERVARGGQPVFMTQGIHGDLAGSESIVAMNLRAVACLPLEAMSPEQETDTPAVMGILYLDSRKHMHSLSGLDEKLLTRLADEAGHVLEKLEMVVTLAERKRIEQELAIAEETQRSLLPRSLPQAEPFRIRAFCRPTRQLGGDFYDFIPVQGGELTGVLADVSGKGIPAALLSSLTLGALNMEFRSSARPDLVLNGVNKLLCAKTPAHRFVTMFLFQLDAAGRGHFISAGHNSAYLFRAAAGEVEELPSGGIPLGMFPFAVYKPVPLELNPGDILVVYSDGLTEAENGAQEDFGEERLLALIRSTARQGAEALESKLLAELDQFTQGAAQTDDITFLLIENRASVPQSHRVS
jgi:serine phosphatase RsbU (regulator of sigma subunit)